MIPDTRPIALIPAYKPEPVILTITATILHSGLVQSVVCVDDGSGLEYQSLFEALRVQGVTVLRHFTNMGKGMALRTGMNHIACGYPDATGIVTLDADGQHLATDVCAVAAKLQQQPRHLIMGCRTMHAHAPWRSRFGNALTKKVMHICTGVALTDTQTGLRGIPMLQVPDLLHLSSNGYDFETEMLVTLHAAGVPIHEVPIDTVYIDSNRSSHFRPIRDSLAIYFVFLRNAGNSLGTAFIDYLVFTAMLACSYSLASSLVVGRIVAGFFNFYVGKTFVFKSRNRPGRELVSYGALVAILTVISYHAINWLIVHTGLTSIPSKLLVESGIFLASFAIQRVYVFNSPTAVPTETDWDGYYLNRSSRGSPTRKITGRLLLAALAKYPSPPIQSIAEFGGGDSCFYPTIRRRFPAAIYLVADKSVHGIRKFKEVNGATNCDAFQVDLLHDNIPRLAEVVFSVGLIEHFNVADTAKIVESHFKAVTAGGIVIITYPTPTWLYRVIRTLAELLGIWRFHDERPLQFTEVERAVHPYGTIIYRQMNWFIGLTQEILVIRDNRKAD